MPTDAGEPRLPVMLGALRKTTADRRKILAFLVNSAEQGPDGIEVSDDVKTLASEIVELGRLAECLEWMLSRESNFHALWRHQPLAGLPCFRAVRTNDLLDGKLALIRARIHMDCGELVNIDLAGKGWTRFAVVARPEVIGIEV